MQQPAMAAQLRRELQQLQAGIPRPLLSFDELPTHFIMVADLLAGKLLSVSAMEHGSTTKGAHTAPARSKSTLAGVQSCDGGAADAGSEHAAQVAALQCLLVLCYKNGR